MKEQIALLQNSSAVLQNKISTLTGENSALNSDMAALNEENSSLKTDIVALQKAVAQLQQSEVEINAKLADLQNLADNQKNVDLGKQLEVLQAKQSTLGSELAELGARLEVIETNFKQAPTSGIFSYIESEEHRGLLATKVEEALAQDLTYAQIDEFLTRNLPSDLDEVIKAHPALTKNYIRNLRRD
jgi:chromosome segregation ATPase